MGEDLRLTMNERQLYMNERKTAENKNSKNQDQEIFNESLERGSASTDQNRDTNKSKKGNTSNIFMKN